MIPVCDGCGTEPSTRKRMTADGRFLRCCEKCDWERRRLAGPTDVMPGSEEKILLLRRRCELGLPIHHPGDRKVGHRLSNDVLIEKWSNQFIEIEEELMESAPAGGARQFIRLDEEMAEARW